MFVESKLAVSVNTPLIWIQYQMQEYLYVCGE